MSDKPSSRRKFLQMLGLTAGATILSTKAVAGFVDHKEILKLNPEQQEFMLRYEKWMDAFIEVIRVQRTKPEDAENNAKMIELTEIADSFKPELDGFMKDKKFSTIFQVSIARMSKEI
jgi:hypothetical protein